MLMEVVFFTKWGGKSTHIEHKSRNSGEVTHVGEGLQRRKIKVRKKLSMDLE